MIYNLLFRRTVLFNASVWWWPTAMVVALFWCSRLISIAFV